VLQCLQNFAKFYSAREDIIFCRKGLVLYFLFFWFLAKWQVSLLPAAPIVNTLLHILVMHA